MTLRPAPSPHPLDTLIVCRSAVIEQLRLTAVRVAAGDTRVLITGESGVGKDVLARFIHGRSKRASAACVTVSAIGLPEATLGVQLFGPLPGQASGEGAMPGICANGRPRRLRLGTEPIRPLV